MRIDVVTIFPDYLKVLDLSLIGKAADRGPLDLHVHDLRDHAHDRHRTVDDTPLGGGAGMVMKPDVWGEALDEVRPVRSSSSPPPPGRSSPSAPPRTWPEPNAWSSPVAATRASTRACPSTTPPAASRCAS